MFLASWSSTLASDMSTRPACMADTAAIISGAAAAAAVLAAGFAASQAMSARRSASAAEEQVTAARAQATAAEREAHAAEESARIAREELELTREHRQQDAEKELEASRPRLEPMSPRPAPGAFNLRLTEPLEFSAWLVNRGPGSAAVDQVRLDIGDGGLLRGSPRAEGGAQPVEELIVGEGDEFNLYVPASPELTGLINTPNRPLQLEVRFSAAGQPGPQWWTSVRLEPKLGETGRHQWIATSVTVRHAP